MLSDEELQRMYQWVDEIPLSRPKRNITRDFADGMLAAEIVSSYFPRLVEVHNYPASNSYAQKVYNWETLERKVLKKIGCALTKEEIDNLANCVPQAVERMLHKLHGAMAKYSAKKQAGEDDPPAPTGASRSAYKPPPKPDPRAPTVAKAPCAARMTTKASTAAGAARAAGTGGAGAGAVDPSMARLASGDSGDDELAAAMAEKDMQLAEQRETIQILEVKIGKLEQLVRLKESKINSLQTKLLQQQQQQQQQPGAQ